jgi:glycosyltransferase involved in cell wall biosynthesis
MRIIFITEFYPNSVKLNTKGGVETNVFNIARKLAEKHDVTVICSRQIGQKRNDCVLGVKILRVGPVIPYSNEGHIIKRFLFAFAALLAARRIKADIAIGTVFLGYMAALHSGKKCMLEYHECWIGEWIERKGLWTGIFGEAWERIIRMHRIEKIIAVSKFSKDTLIRKGFSSKICVIPNGINKKEFDIVRAKKKPNSIITVSRLIESKRIFDVIEAAKILPHVNFIIIGSGPLKEKVETAIKDIKNIKLEGFVENHATIKKMIKESSLFCHPSISEGFGIVIIEAAAAGTPFVCADIAVLKEVSKGGVGGLLFRQKDYKDMAKKIESLLNDKMLYEKKLKECKTLAELYSWDKIACQFEKEIMKTFSGKSRRGHNER